MKGRPRIPSQLKLVKGTFRPDRAPKREPRPPTGIGPAPDYLNAEQAAAWRAFAEASPPGLLTATDRGIFESYVVLFAVRRAVLRAFNEGGGQVLVRDRSRGRTARNPLLRELQRLAVLLARLESELGYSPAARSRVDLSVDPAPDRLSKYLS